MTSNPLVTPLISANRGETCAVCSQMSKGSTEQTGPPLAAEETIYWGRKRSLGGCWPGVLPALCAGTLVRTVPYFLLV